MKKLHVLLIVSSIIIGCHPKAVPVASKAVAPETTETKLADTIVKVPAPVDMAVAEQQFKMVCSNCHDLPKPAEKNAGDWTNTVARMQRKSGFSDSQKEQILAYLIANARP